MTLYFIVSSNFEENFRKIKSFSRAQDVNSAIFSLPQAPKSHLNQHVSSRERERLMKYPICFEISILLDHVMCYPFTYRCRKYEHNQFAVISSITSLSKYRMFLIGQKIN
jgi:hypothetical protein